MPVPCAANCASVPRWPSVAANGGQKGLVSGESSARRVAARTVIMVVMAISLLEDGSPSGSA